MATHAVGHHIEGDNFCFAANELYLIFLALISDEMGAQLFYLLCRQKRKRRGLGDGVQVDVRHVVRYILNDAAQLMACVQE